MSKRGNIEKSLKAIMALKGIDEFKELVKRQNVFMENNEAHFRSDINLPNLFVKAKSGYGFTTAFNAYTDFLHAAKAIDFCGEVKFFEFKLDHIKSDFFFSELSRLDATLKDLAGRHHQFTGVVGIDINAWVEHSTEEHFGRFLDYITSNSNRILFVFYLHTDHRNIETIETVISSHVRFESLTFGFPDATELVEYFESQYMNPKGYCLLEDAKILLCEAISELVMGKYFKGFKSIDNLAQEIMFNLLTADNIGEQKQISADRIASYGKNSAYVKRATSKNVIKKSIGFAERAI